MSSSSQSQPEEYSSHPAGRLEEIDPAIYSVIQFEAERQREKLILIASESICPQPVREALSSELTNLYAEGYPLEKMARATEAELVDSSAQLSRYRRESNNRYYKGCEYADLVESLAIRRASEIFATDECPAEKIYVNVQPLSGAAANNAVYNAFVKHSDTVMGMALPHGGHLTHGSPVNRSGINHRIVSYGIHQETGRIDYGEIRQLAEEHKPRMIIGGYSAYPWGVDWKEFKDIADSVDAILLADISHYAGLVVAGLYPNPVGIADVTTLTTHKTLCGPRGAIILTTDQDKAKAIDFGVFPGEQGGPHLNSIAARAVSFRLAATPEFKDLQHRIVKNCQALAAGLERRDVQIAYGGTESHLCLFDLRSIVTRSDAPLRGEMASRLLDLCGITVNKNTIAGDTSAVEPNGIRLGTAWITQRGLGEDDMDTLAGLIHLVLSNCRPYTYSGPKGFLRYGAKLPIETFEEAQKGVATLISGAEPGSESELFGYPHYTPVGRKTEAPQCTVFEITGRHAPAFLQNAASRSLINLQPGEGVSTNLLDSRGQVLDTVRIKCVERDRYLLQASDCQPERVHRWLSLLSDGYVEFDPEDPSKTLDGPVVVNPLADAALDDIALPECSDDSSLVDATKPYYIGQPKQSDLAHSKEVFAFDEAEGELKHTCLYDIHAELTSANRIIPFGGWAMPVCYNATSIAYEHDAVRNAAALFDVTHMGILEFSGQGAARFLDLVTTNEVTSLPVGRVHYAFLLAPDGSIIDDITLYRLAEERFMMVVNASNAEKVEAWLRGVNERRLIIDGDFPAKEVDAAATIRNLKDDEAGGDQRVDLALQGPHSLPLLDRMIECPDDRAKLRSLMRFSFITTELRGSKVILASTGYTGEPNGYEIYIHPDQAPKLWSALLETGEDLGVIPSGLGARDSTRIEAGFPLYGHELAGPHSVSPAEAGYPFFVKLNKPFFVGRTAMVAHRQARTKQVVRFEIDEKRARAVRTEDPITDGNGTAVGYVTSCTRIGDKQIGLAYVNRSLRSTGTPLTIIPQPRTKREEARKPEPIEGNVIARFLKK